MLWKREESLLDLSDSRAALTSPVSWGWPLIVASKCQPVDSWLRCPVSLCPTKILWHGHIDYVLRFRQWYEVKEMLLHHCMPTFALVTVVEMGQFLFTLKVLTFICRLYWLGYFHFASKDYFLMEYMNQVLLFWILGRMAETISFLMAYLPMKLWVGSQWMKVSIMMPGGHFGLTVYALTPLEILEACSTFWWSDVSVCSL